MALGGDLTNPVCRVGDAILVGHNDHTGALHIPDNQMSAARWQADNPNARRLFRVLVAEVTEVHTELVEGRLPSV